MKAWLKNKYIVLALIAATFFSLLVFKDSFRSTLARRRAIRDTQVQIEHLDQEISKTKSQLASLETQPHVQEDLVRRELGYIKPGEKEIRFIQSSPKK